MNLSDVAISNIEITDYRYILSRISKNVAVNLIKNVYLTEKSKTL